MHQPFQFQITNVETFVNRARLERFVLIALLLAGFAFLPALRAVLPAPDGGYPGSNTAEGTNALFGLTSGTRNTALGFNTLYNDRNGSGNTATGTQAFLNKTRGG